MNVPAEAISPPQSVNWSGWIVKVTSLIVVVAVVVADVVAGVVSVVYSTVVYAWAAAKIADN